MDLTQGQAALVADSLLQLWHTYRVPLLLLLTVGILVVGYSPWSKRRDRERFNGALTPPPSIDDKIFAEKRLKGVDIDVPLKQEPRIKGPRRIVGGPKKTKQVGEEVEHTFLKNLQVIIFSASLGGSSEFRATKLKEWLESHAGPTKSPTAAEILPPILLDLASIELEDYFVKPPTSTDTRYVYLILVPSYDIDTILDTFLEHLQDTHHDFRIDTSPLASLLGYAVFGFGDREGWPTEQDGFCSQAIAVDKWLAKLTGRKRAYPIGMGDVKSDVEMRIAEWQEGVRDVLVNLAGHGELGEGVPGSGNAVESEDEEEDEKSSNARGSQRAAGQDKSRMGTDSGNLHDLEDMGTNTDALSENLETDFTTTNLGTRKSKVASAAPKEMVPVSSPTYKALTKQGYSIVGSHSGVKICRWTKSALRGRGSCYKYSFYGIASHRCMETTPSLSCSNKCVFCWRHGTNPVGTSWRWVVDPPDVIFHGVKEQHHKKIKMLRGVPGVRAERFSEAMRIRHCALSLVGEPIFYPYINEFLALLHAEHISSFLVCNAQHPDQLATLRHVTQLYVSIDASNRESLRRIDRPLHRDFWERFQRCLAVLRARRFEQRTVFRLTLVKGFNIDDEVTGYADLVEQGLPCFIEIKGVTYCGTSTAAGAGLTMQNVPFYEEVCAFVRALDTELARRQLGYGIAAEHAHSCCVLLASERFKREGKWCTRIDYERFFELLERGKPFRPEEYMGEETPEWALWGRGGFDPRDERVYRKGKAVAVVEEA